MKAEILRKKFFEGVSRYEWIETLGQGGVGIVYKARDLELDEVVAIKVLSPDLAKDDEAVLARFKREINLNRKIKHPNVARMYDFGISGSYPYITMEFVPGKDLWTLIRDERRIEPARAVPILRQIARLRAVRDAATAAPARADRADELGALAPGRGEGRERILGGGREHRGPCLQGRLIARFREHASPPLLPWGTLGACSKRPCASWAGSSRGTSLR